MTVRLAVRFYDEVDGKHNEGARNTRPIPLNLCLLLDSDTQFAICSSMGNCKYSHDDDVSNLV